MKQTGPISRRNGSPDSPMCVGATSIIGRASLRLVSIFSTAWRLPLSFCCKKYKWNKQISNRTNDRKDEGTNRGKDEGTNKRISTNEHMNEWKKWANGEQRKEKIERMKERKVDWRTDKRSQTTRRTGGWIWKWKHESIVEKRWN